MADFLELVPLFATETEEVIRARMDSWANEGLSTTDPARVDTREGSVFQVCTEGSVRELARVYDKAGTEALAASTPLYASGTQLDDHAQTQGLTRLAAVAAEGIVRFTGPAGSVIGTGTGVEVEIASISAPEVSFVTTASGTIPVGGYIDLAVRAQTVGVIGNVSAYAITILITPVPGASVSNLGPIVGGTDPETDEALRSRILGSLRGLVPGNQVYYERYARNYSGVGRASVIPLYAGDGTLLVVVSTATGGPVAQSVVDGLQLALDPPSFSTTLSSSVAIGATTLPVVTTTAAYPSPGTIELENDVVRYTGTTATSFTGVTGVTATHASGVTLLQRQSGAGGASIGAYVKVKTSASVAITVSATVAFERGYSLDGTTGGAAIRAVIQAAVAGYINAQVPGGVVYYSKVLGAIADLNGVKDVTSVLVNGATSNISLSFNPPQVPTLTTLTLT
jgi:uncharacterized phage protein gp47/JayE